MDVFYLHGFASSLNGHRITLRCPDFNQPEFATLTMTRMLDQLDAEIVAMENADVPVTLIGSSLGGTLAILAAARFGPRVGRTVLMAPAVMFAKAGHHLLPPDRLDEWHLPRIWDDMEAFLEFVE